MESLKSRRDPLADPETQLRSLEQAGGGSLPLFAKKLQEIGLWPFKPLSIETLQINLGKQCNQTCRHCHVDAGPDRKEIMSRATLEECLRVLRENPSIARVDLTGGAPEMNPHFRWFVEEVRGLGREVMVRCNLTILLAGRGFTDLPEFFQRNRVHVVSSLPHYSSGVTDRQRGNGVFTKSIEALRRLNSLGYGREAGLELDLVFNPAGAFLPSSQSGLEADFKRKLKTDFDIDFGRLFTITNMPVSRYLEFLLASGNFEAYMAKLVSAFNPEAAKGVMCRGLVSVGWDGRLYDCDFNQMLELGIAVDSTPDGDSNHSRVPLTIREFSSEGLLARAILVHQHCYGCTAGAGSSCGGSLA